MHRVASVEALSGYRMRLCFADGLEGEVDLADLAGKGVFASWQDRSEFEAVFADPETDTVAWPGGIDLAPEVLYRDIAAVRAT